MEEEKAAAYYDELTRKGGGAARFKQGLGFSSATSSDDPPSRGSALPSSTSSFMSNFVRASSPGKSKELEKESQLLSIQNKLKKKEPTSIDAPSEKIRVRDRSSPRRRSRSRERDRCRERERDSRRWSRSRSRSRERRRRRRSRPRIGGSEEERERSRRRRYRSSSTERRDRDRDRDRDREGWRRRSRSRTRSSSDGERRLGIERGRSRSVSPRDRRYDKGREVGRRERKVVKKEDNGTVDYAKLIDGYDKMTPAERVKAKMKLQLSQTARKDAMMGTGSGWERFDFDKDAPVDDEEIAVGDDDAAVVKRISQSFRFSSLEVKREDEIRSAHDEAMFGAPGPAPSHTSESEGEREDDNKKTNDDVMASSLINEKVLAKQQGSWRDRARRNVG